MEALKKSKGEWIPNKGCWIMIREFINVEIPVPPLSIWYGIPSKKDFFKGELSMSWFNEKQFVEKFARLRFDSVSSLRLALKSYHSNKSILDDHEKAACKEAINTYGIDLERQMKIKTPFGEVCIQPHEYTVVKDLNKYLEAVDEGSVQIKHLSANATFRGKLKEQLFYLRSRGISLPTALTMVSGNITTQNAFYLLFHPVYIQMLNRLSDHYISKENRFKLELVQDGKGDVLKSYFFDEQEAEKIQRKYNSDKKSA